MCILKFYFVAGLLILAPVERAIAQDVGTPTPSSEIPRVTETRELNAAQLFEFADKARDRGDYESAEAAYRALAANPDIELRSEARFRLALMLDAKLGRSREAAVLLREILDEKPDAAPVRVELARIRAGMGDLRAAERELRAASSADLPPEVERLLRFYAAALNSQRTFGATAEITLAPDSNINRATRSETLGTIIGEFDLSDDAQAQSGIGVFTRAQLWARVPIVGSAMLQAELNGSGRFYREGQFDDHAIGFEVGPKLRIGQDQLSFAAVVQRRWYGGRSYNLSYGGEATYMRPLDMRTRLRGTVNFLSSDDELNELRDAQRTAATLGLDRALSSRFGGGMELSGQRSSARDPGFSTASGGVSGYLYHEFGPTTLAVNAGYSHLEADERLFLYPRRRIDDRLSAGVSGTFRALRVGSFAPVLRLRYERNWSTVEIYDYRRISADFGVSAAF